MSTKSVRGIRLALLIALSFATARGARPQAIEQLVGSWMYLAFGSCGVYGCLTGPRLCALIQSGAALTWCYEH